MKKLTISLVIVTFWLNPICAMENKEKKMSIEKKTPAATSASIPKTKISLFESNRKEIAAKLNKLLANEYILYTKTLKYHWNVKGKHFGPLHTLFREQYEQLFTIIDDTAERVVSLGFEALGTLNEFSKQATLAEQPENPTELNMIKNLLADHETIIKQIREDINTTVELNDAGTNNFLSDLIEKQEKMAWMLRAHLK